MRLYNAILKLIIKEKEIMQRTYDDRMFIDTFEHQFTWLNGFMRNVTRYGKKLAIIDPAEDKTWTYEEFNREANRLAHALRIDGV